MIKAVSFDLWDTLIADESDEPKRRARGLRSKRDERRHLVWQALDAVEPVPLDRVVLAYDVADAAFNRVWHDQHVTWTVSERLGVVLDGLGRSLPEADFARLVAAHEDMEAELPPDPIAGANAALAELAGRYKLCVVSDAIVSPGRTLRRILETHDLARHFSAFAFSDEVGRSKPHRSMFGEAARQLGVEFADMVHIGDRDHNDVKGAHALGMKAVLFTAARDRDKDITTADRVCADYRDLPAVIDDLAAA